MARIGVVLPGSFADAGDFLADARALEAAGVDSLWIDSQASDLDPWLLLAAVAAVTSRVRLGLIQAEPGVTAGRSLFETLDRLSRSRALAGVRRGSQVEVTGQPGAPAEQWVVVPTVDATALATAADAAVLVPMAPGLLDLLRRPEQADDRSDLILSQG